MHVSTATFADAICRAHMIEMENTDHSEVKLFLSQNLIQMDGEKELDVANFCETSQ